MENKEKQTSKHAEAKKINGDEEKKQANLLKAKLNNFLINYFSYLAWGLAIIVFSLGLLLFVLPNYKKINQSNQMAKESLLVEYEKKAEYLKSVIDLKKSFQLISAEEEKKLKALVPVSGDTSGIISEIEQVALKNGAILNSVKVTPQDSKAVVKSKASSEEKDRVVAGIFNKLTPGVNSLKIEISLGAINYPVLKSIIKTFENNLRLFDIAKIDYDASGNKAVLIVYSYYLE